MVNKILLIEPDAMLQAILHRKLSSGGYHVHETDGASRHIEELSYVAVATQPDWIVLNLSLPYIDGFSLIQSLRSHPETRNSQVMVHTALRDDHIKERCERSQAGYILREIEEDIEFFAGRLYQALKNKEKLLGL